MTAVGATSKQVDLGLAAKLQAAVGMGEVVYRTPLIQVNSTDVAVFFEHPDIDNFQDRIFPSISIEGVYKLDRSRMESYIWDRIVRDTMAGTQTIYHDPEPYQAQYTIHLFARNASDIRDLEDGARSVFLTNDYIVANSEEWEARRMMDTFISIFYADQRVYHSFFVFEVDYTFLPNAAVSSDIPYVQTLDVEYQTQGTSKTFLVSLSDDGVTVEEN